jgi:kynureninase
MRFSQYNDVMADDLLRYRSEFPILENTTYLISNSLGAMPRQVRDALQEYADTWATRGVRAWEEHWWMLSVEVGDAIGALLNAPAGSVSTHQNVTTCQAIVASCFDFNGKRNKVVYTDLNFPSVMYFWEAQRKRGARVHMVPTDDGVHVNTERLLDAIDEETLLVPISHVIFRSAFIQDAKAIIEKAHRVGALVVLDTYQSLGTVPVDVQALDTDFCTGGTLKWLCGGPGVAYLYVKPELAKKFEPTFTGWFAHENPFAFETGPIKYTSDPPFRFMNGTTHVPSLYAARPGLKIIREVGVESIREKSKWQTTRLIQMAEERGWKVNTPRDPEQRGGTVSIEMPNTKEVCAELIKCDVLVDYRPNAGVRMSPHFYNTDEELDVGIATVEEILEGMGIGAAAR